MRYKKIFKPKKKKKKHVSSKSEYSGSMFSVFSRPFMQIIPSLFFVKQEFIDTNRYGNIRKKIFFLSFSSLPASRRIKNLA